MKKVILSPEALALLADDELKTSAKEKDLEVKEPELKEPEVKEPEVKVKTITDDEVTKTLKESFASLTEEFNALTEGFETFKTETAEATVKAAEAAEAKVEEVKESFSGVKGIVTDQIAKMRISLSIAAVDMKDWDVEAIMAEYEGTSKAFMKAMPVGSVVPEKEEETKAAKSSHDVSAIKSLGFN